MKLSALTYIPSMITTHPALLASIVAAPLLLTGCIGDHESGSDQGDDESEGAIAETSDALTSQITNESYGDVGTLATGLYDACAIKTDGTVQCWGRNVDYNPAPSPAGTFTQIDSGGDGSCGVRPDGTVSCWNQYWNFYGAPPAGTFSRVALGDRHVCGIKTDGTLQCWGDNSYGQLNAPAGTFLGISSNFNTSCGVRTDGTLACWGYDGYYSFGLLNPPAGQFTQVTIGPWHACAIRAADSGVTCWGMYGTAQSPAGTFKKIVAGGGPGYDYDYTCGIMTDGSIACWYGWSSNFFQTLPGNYAQIAARYGTCALAESGAVSCFRNVYWPNPLEGVPAGLVAKTHIDTPLPGQPATVQANIGDWGYGDRRWMVDFNGDGKADYCRAVGNSGGPSSWLGCSLSTGVGLGGEYQVMAPISDWGYGDRRWMVDFNGDGKIDYCRAVGNWSGQDSFMACSLSNGSTFGGEYQVMMQVWDWGYADRRWFVDFNGDGKADYCRAVGNSSGPGSYIACSLSTGSGFVSEYTVMMPIGDWGYGDRRWMVDFNGDGKADYCRAVGNSGGANSWLGCSLSNGSGFGGEYQVMAPIADWGYGDKRFLIDYNGDGKIDYCRSVGAGDYLACSLSNGATFGGEYEVMKQIADWGPADRRWFADFNGDKRADLIRASSSNGGIFMVTSF